MHRDVIEFLKAAADREEGEAAHYEATGFPVEATKRRQIAEWCRKEIATFSPTGN